MIVARIDKHGYFVEDVILDRGDVIPSDCVETRPDTVNNVYYRAKWTGTEWVEDMTQEEIDALNSQPKPKTQLEILQETVDILVLDNLGVL